MAELRSLYVLKEIARVERKAVFGARRWLQVWEFREAGGGPRDGGPAIRAVIEAPGAGSWPQKG